MLEMLREEAAISTEVELELVDSTNVGPAVVHSSCTIAKSAKYPVQVSITLQHIGSLTKIITFPVVVGHQTYKDHLDGQKHKKKEAAVRTGLPQVFYGSCIILKGKKLITILLGCRCLHLGQERRYTVNFATLRVRRRMPMQRTFGELSTKKYGYLGTSGFMIRNLTVLAALGG